MGPVVVAYDSAWPRLFRIEAARLHDRLGAVLRKLHHIGSTSVPGLSAKPIIDLLGEAPDLAGLDGCDDAFTGLGYEVMGAFGIPGRRYFRKTDAQGRRTHHLHVFAVGSPELTRHLAFRDYLRTHPAVAAEYAGLKLGLVQAGGDMEAYVAGKDPFVKHVERIALDWRGRAEPHGV